MFVDVPGDRYQVREHGIADGTGHRGIGQGIQPHVDDAFAADHLHPFEDGTCIALIQIVG